MPASEPKVVDQKKLSGIFISYRRSDTPDAVGRIYDRLVSEFGKARVFKDVDSIPLGQDFRGHLNDIVGGCAAVLAIVGPRWVDTRNSAGQRRLEDPDDFVRIELEAALARNIPVVPVLVGHAPMPGTADLPTSLASMAFRQSIEVRPDPDFHNDATRLVAALWAIVDPDAPRAKTSSATPARPPLAQRVWPALAATTLAAIAFAIPAVKHLRETPPPETRLDIVTPATIHPTSFALSPDGRQIAFVASADGASRLWLRSLATTTAQPMAGTEGVTDFFWSHDGRSIGFFAGGDLKRLDLSGGASQTLTRATAARGGTWSAGGVILFAPNGSSPILRMAASGGETVAVTKVGPQQAGHRYPHFLPDGQRFLFYVRGAADTAGIYLGALDGSTPTRLTPADSAGEYLSGWLLWVRAGTLVAQRLDLAKATLTGEPVTLADGVMVDDVRVQGGLTVAPGLVAYRAGWNGLRRMNWFDRSGTARGAVGEPDGSWISPRVSPDGRRVVASRTVQGNTDVWLLEGDRTSRITFDAAADQFPVLSPDGSRIVFRSFRSGGGEPYQKLTNGTGAEERLMSSDQQTAPSSWSADGRFLFYTAVDPQSAGDLMILPMVGDHTPSVFLKTAFRESSSALSPDGQWVAYFSNQSGRPEVYVRPFVPPGAAGTAPQGGSEQQVSTAGGIYPAWAPDGKEIYYLSPAADMMAAPIRVTGATMERGAPVKLFATRIVNGGTDESQGRQYDVAADGRFLINTVVDSSAAPITLIQNWNPDAGN